MKSNVTLTTQSYNVSSLQVVLFFFSFLLFKQHDGSHVFIDETSHQGKQQLPAAFGDLGTI